MPAPAIRRFRLCHMPRTPGEARRPPNVSVIPLLTLLFSCQSLAGDGEHCPKPPSHGGGLVCPSRPVATPSATPSPAAPARVPCCRAGKGPRSGQGTTPERYCTPAGWMAGLLPLSPTSDKSSLGMHSQVPPLPGYNTLHS